MTLLHDFRYGARMLAKNPGVTTVALITLTLSIGVNTGMFSIVNAVEHVVPRRLTDPDQLVVLYRTFEHKTQGPVCPIDCGDYREQVESVSDIGAYRSTSLTLTGQGEPEQVRGLQVTANLLPTLGFSASLGRLHTEEEDSPAGESVVLLTDRLWERRFASNPDVLGQTIVLNDRPHTIIGLLPQEFRLEGMGWYYVDLLVPLQVDPAVHGRGESRVRAIARLNEGVTIEQARTEFDMIAARLAETYPGSNAQVGVGIQPMMDWITSPEDRLAFRAVLAAVGLVLLIACLNLANLLLAKATARGREFAVRAAIGAGRARIVRQLLTESLLLATLGGALGLLIGRWGVDAFIATQEYMPLQRHEVGLNGAVLTYTLVLSVLAALGFGLAPALTATRVSVNEVLQEGQAAASSGHRRNRLRNALIVGQLAIAVPLLICCGLTLRHVTGIRTIDLGFRTDHLLTAEVDLPAHRYTTDAREAAFFHEAIEAIEAMPGIESAGATATLPVYSRSVIGAPVTIEGYDTVVSRTAAEDVHGYQPVTPGFFETLEAPLVSGRLFTELDHADGQPVAIVNERMAKRYWPDENPIGRRLTLDKHPSDATWITVVGVVGDIGRSLIGSLPGPPAPTLYVPHQQRPYGRMSVVARTVGDPVETVSSLRSAIHDIDAGIPVHEFRTIQGVWHDLCRDDRLAAAFLGGLAVLALGLASIGLYGVMSYSVLQRTHEIGVRVALGADRNEITRLILKRCLRLAAIGIVIGIGLSIPVGLAIQSQLYRVSGIDPVAYLGVSVVLLAVAALAGYVPARRATRINPLVALRYE